MSKQIKVGMIGCGYWGPKLIRNFGRIQGSSVEIVSDINEARLNRIKEEYPFILTTRDPSEVIRNREVDAIAIQLPSELTTPWL